MADRLEGSGASQLVQLIQQIGFNDFDSIHLATVTASSPLKIKVDGMKIELDADDLVVAEHLTRHERVVTLTHAENTVRQLGDGTGTDRLDTDDGQTPLTSFAYNYVLLKFEDVLKVGDRVIVSSMNNGQTYVILDRAVTI